MSRRRLTRHAAALSFSLGEARGELSSEQMEPRARAVLKATVERLEREISRLRIEALTAPPPSASELESEGLYDASARD